MRIIVIYSSYFMGIALPALEVFRRKTNFDQFAYYADDFIIAALLFYSTDAVRKNKPQGRLLLVVAWAILCGGFYYSFFGQVYANLSSDISGASNALVVGVKGCLFVCAIANLVISVSLAGKK